MSDDTQAQIENEPPDSITTIPLHLILPDPGQPRRLLPADLLEAVIAGHISRIEAVEEWLRQAELATKETALSHHTAKLKRLAESIERHGLISPISVRQPRPDEPIPGGTKYLIVTGERRYWAYVYLLAEGRSIQEGETITRPDQIKATIAPPGVTVRAHQLIENLLREDINAVEKARGMWALRQELSGVNHGSPSPEGPQPELVPWARVEETLGISKRYRIFNTSVLKLCPEALTLIETHNLAERTIRPIVQKLKDRPELQIKALQQVIAWQMEAQEEGESSRGSIIVSVKEMVEKLLTGEKNRRSRSVSSEPALRFQSKVRQTLDFLNRLKPTDREGLTKALSREEFSEVMIDLRNLRQQIDTLLETTSSPPSSSSE